MKKKIKLYFTDFWPNFIIDNNYFLDILSNDYDITITDTNPDFLFYSVFGTHFHRFNCPRIFFTGENVRPDFNDCDWAFSFDYSNDGRNYRLPLYPFFGDINKLTQPKPNIEEFLAQKTHFCNFIYSNAGPKERIHFFKQLSKYKKVDSAGRLLNNMNERIVDKQEFISRYKFTIAFENISYPGYTTEKVFEPMLVNSIPIYWGNKSVGRDFNTKSFLNYTDFESEEALIDRIIELDQNPEKMAELLAQPYFIDNQFNEFVNPKNVLARFDHIFSSDIIPVSSKSPVFAKGNAPDPLELLKIDSKFKREAYIGMIKRFSMTKLKIKVKRFFEK